MCRMSWNLGASNFWNPQGQSRPVMGLLYHFLFIASTVTFGKEDLWTFTITSRWIRHRMWNVSDIFVGKIKTRTLRSIIFFSFENRAVYEMMRKNIAEPDRPQMTIWRMGIARWIPQATNTHSEYVILIDFPLPQWLHERASILRYTYITCLVLC